MSTNKTIFLLLGMLSIMVVISFCFRNHPQWNYDDVAVLISFFNRCDPATITSSRIFCNGELKVLVAPQRVDSDGVYCTKVIFKNLTGQLEFVWAEGRCTRKSVLIYAGETLIYDSTTMLE